MIPQLQSISDDLAAGRTVEPVTVRTFLEWFEAQRRGREIVRRIRKELAAANLETEPDFESQWIEARIDLRRPAVPPPATDEAAAATDAKPEAAEEALAAPGDATGYIPRDAAHRISKLRAANAGVVFVAPNASLTETVTRMMEDGYSQLPVMTSERTVRGMVSWKSIGSRLAFGRNGGQASHYMIDHRELPHTASIFDAIPIIAQSDYVLVRGPDNRITGIVTDTDLSDQFRLLTEPFLLLSEIENSIRNLIGDRFTPAELAAVRNEHGARPIEGVDDLTFGDYVRLLENTARWPRMNLGLDRAEFCRRLDAVREIRNDVTHFDPDGITPEQLQTLQRFRSFLVEVQAIVNLTPEEPAAQPAQKRPPRRRGRA